VKVLLFQLNTRLQQLLVNAAETSEPDAGFVQANVNCKVDLS